MRPLDHLTDAMDGSTSLGLVLTFSLACVIACGIAISLALAARRRARDAEEAIAGARVLRDGATLIRGVARTDGEAAIKVKLYEDGREWKAKDGYHHEWVETHRKTVARPFFVVTDCGERVRVEPPRDVFLIDALRVSRVRGERRKRVAELRDGERVAVTGRLRRQGATGAGAYRSAGEGWVLEPNGPMIVSTEPLADRHRAWSRFFAFASLLPLVLFVVVSVVAYTNLYDFVLHGHPVIGTVMEGGDFPTRGSGHETHHYRVLIDMGEREVWLPVDTSGYRRVSDQARVAMVVTPDGHVFLGSDPGLRASAMVAMLVLGVLASVVVWTQRQRRKLWWEQKRVITKGRGRL